MAILFFHSFLHSSEVEILNESANLLYVGDFFYTLINTVGKIYLKSVATQENIVRIFFFSGTHSSGFEKIHSNGSSIISWH